MKKLLSLPPNLVECFHDIMHADHKEWFCTSDPVGKKLGSGGGTAWLLNACREEEDKYNPQNEKMRVSETKGLKNPQIPKTKRLLFIQTHKRQRNPKTTRFPASCFIHSIQTEHHLYRKSN